MQTVPQGTSELEAHILIRRPTMKTKQQERRWWSREIPNLTVGLDVGDRVSALCQLDIHGEVLQRRGIATTTPALRKYFSALPRARVVLEAGTHSAWISRLLAELGHEVIVANPAELRGRRKSDPIDAEFLARQGRADPALLHPIRHRGPQAQADLALLSARDALVRSRTLQINHVRGLVKSFGSRIPSCSAESFHKRAAEHLPEPLRPALEPLLEMIQALTQKIRHFDAQIEHACQENHPETARLRQIAGVGAMTSLCYVLVLEEPDRFRDRRAIGSYLGLVPKLRESGGKGRGPELSISKAGHVLLRRLLVGSAHYILGPHGPETDLRRWGLQIAERGGKKAKRRAVVAVARKLSVLLHSLWTSGADYIPLRETAPGTKNEAHVN